MTEKRDIRLLIGGRGEETEVQSRDDSPTWIIDQAWDKFWDLAENSLNAYMQFTKKQNKKHSYILGLDLLATGETSPENPGKIIDIRPTILEGPCCNSYPACPNFYPSRLYGRALAAGMNPDTVEYPTHPDKILEKVVKLHKDVWTAAGHKEAPVCAVFTLPYPISEEETAHNLTLNKMKSEGLEAYRITPDEKPDVKDGKLVVNGRPIDVCFRRIERKDIYTHYGEELAKKIINETPGTIFINPFEVDDWRSKTIEEKVFRDYEKETGKKVSRPITLLEDEITPENVRGLINRGGFALKKWNSTGGKGVFLHYHKNSAGKIYDKIYGRYDGRHMTEINDDNIDEILKTFEDFKEDSAIQQMRMIDSRDCGEFNLVYDSRVNVIYNILEDKWEFLSGLSRVVPCGENVVSGNSLLTNVSSGAEMTTLIVGKTKEENPNVNKGRMLTAMLEGKTELDVAEGKSAQA